MHSFRKRNIFNIQKKGVGEFLIEGSEKALLIDTGYGNPEFPKVVGSLTEKHYILSIFTLSIMYFSQQYHALNCVFEIRNKHIGFVPLIMHRKTKLYAL